MTDKTTTVDGEAQDPIDTVEGAVVGAEQADGSDDATDSSDDDDDA